MKPDNIILEGGYDIISIMNGYIYKHTSPSGKAYVGQTLIGVKDRWDSGHGYSVNTIFGKAIKKYGWNNFKHEVLHEIASDDKEELVNRLNSLEIEEIIRHNTVSPHGYNGTLGGRNGFRTEDQKAQISETLTGRKLSSEHSNNISKALQRRWMDAEWRESFSKTMTNIHKDPEFKKKRSKSLSISLKGRKMSKEWKMKLSESAKRRWLKDSEREAASKRAKSVIRERDDSGRFI